MRLPQDRPTNPKDSLAGRWYATVNHDNGDEDTGKSSRSNSKQSRNFESINNQRVQNHCKNKVPTTNNTLGDYVMHNHQVMNRLGVRYEQIFDEKSQYQQYDETKRSTASSRESLPAVPSITSSEDMMRASMRHNSQESDEFSRQPQMPNRSGHQRSAVTDLSKSAAMLELQRYHQHQRKPRSRSPAPDVSFQRYRQQETHSAEKPPDNTPVARSCDRGRLDRYDQQFLHTSTKFLPDKTSSSSTDRQSSQRTRSSRPSTPSSLPRTECHPQPRPLNSRSSSRTSTASPKSSGNANYKRPSFDVLESYHTRQNNVNGFVADQDRRQTGEGLQQQQQPQGLNTFEQRLRKQQNTMREMSRRTVPSQTDYKIQHGEDAIDNERRRHSDVIAHDRRRHAAEDLIGDSSEMQISADVQFPEEKDIDNFVPRPSKDRMELREGHVPASRNNPTHFRTHVDYMDDRDIVQRQYSAFDAVGVDGHRVFPNRALADGNESLASTLPPPHAVQFQHPYAYQPPVQRSITEISCGTNPTPVSPINQQSPPAEKPLVEKSKSFIAMIGASLVPKSCVPIGNLNEAIAAEEEETKMKLKSSLCEYLDPNNDLNDYDSDDSDDNGSPRKRQKNRKYSSFDENSIVDDDRYTRPDSHVRQSPRNLMLQRDFGDGERQFRTRITVHQNGTQNLEVQQHSSQQTIHTTGQRRSNHSSFLPKSVQKRLDNQFAADFQPFEEMELHDALWGSEESPDPIFSSATDPDMMRQQRNSTGRIGVLQETTDLTRRQSGPVLSTKHNSQEFPRSQSATREYLGSGKLEKKKKSDDVGRSKSTGRGTRVEYFLQKLSGQRENQYQSRENELTRKRRSRSLSKEPSRRSNGTTYQDNFETFFGVESAEWSSTENQEKKIPQNNQLKELTKNTPRINARVHNKLDAAWANHEKSASHLKHLDERKSPGSSQRLQQRSFSPSKDQTSQFRLREKISEELPSNRKNQNEDGNGHYMYVAYSRFGDDAQNVLQLCEHQTLPAPNSRHNEVLIRVEACTVSTSDCAIRRGEWPKVSLNPFIIPGTAFVGRVHGGRKAKRWSSHSKFSFTSPIQPGDTVMSLMITGANARYTCVPKSQLIKVPPRINVDKAACLIENYLTAFQVLHMGKKGATRYKEFSLEGRSVLILGGYSAMGRALIELSIAGGAEYCYASASQPHYQMQCGGNVHSIPSFRRQYEALTRWGAIPLSSNPQDWLTLIGGQIDLMVTVYDPSDHALYNEVVTEDHCKALRKDGQVVVICTHPGLNKNEECEDVFDRPSPDSSYYSRQSHNLFRLSALRMKNHHRDKLVEDRTIWYNLFDTWERSKPDRHGNSKNVAKKDLEHLLILLDQDQLHPEVLERIPLSKIGKAQFILEHKRLAGHLVCAPWLNQQTT